MKALMKKAYFWLWVVGGLFVLSAFDGGGFIAVIIGAVLIAGGVVNYKSMKKQEEKKRQNAVEAEQRRIADQKAAEESRAAAQKKIESVHDKERAEMDEYIDSIPTVQITPVPGRVLPPVNPDFANFSYSMFPKSPDAAGTYVAIDVETTGLNVNDSKIVEVSAVRFVDYQPQEIFTTLINPEMPIPAGATKVNGITNDMVKHAPTFPQILDQLQAFVGHYPLVAHNLPFDIKFLYNEGLQIYKSRKLYDTLTFSRRFIKNVRSHKLIDVCDYCRIRYNPHRATADAMACGMLFDVLVNGKY